MMSLPYKPTIQQVNDEIVSRYGVNLFVLRLDLIHPHISGNKWFKLKYNLEEAQKNNAETLLSFGGAYSNHIAALAFAGKQFGFKTIGIIRGDKASLNPSKGGKLNTTLEFAQSCGMKLYFVSREDYRKLREIKNYNEVISNFKLETSYEKLYLIPEGGANDLGVKGCAEILKDVDLNFDFVCASCGTSTTLSGLILSLKNKQQAFGFSSLKGGEFLEKAVQDYLTKFNCTNKNWKVIHDYHFGRYAKVTKELIDFVNWFYTQNKIQLDFVYTGKMMFGIYDMIKKGFFVKGETILAIHSGGLQGNEVIASQKN